MRTRLQAGADRAAESLWRAIGADLHRMREDAGLTKAAVARAAGIDPTYLELVESARRNPSMTTLCRIAAVLGADISVRAFPNSGPLIHDRIQAQMVEALLRVVGPGWDRHVEVPVLRPVRGVIDVVLARVTAGRVVSIEAHSEIRRLEQQLRWAADKSDALPSATIWPAITSGASHIAISRVLLLRSTASTRNLARSFASTLSAAYPAEPRDVYDAILDPAREWPGNGILWVRVDNGTATILRGRPRGVVRP